MPYNNLVIHNYYICSDIDISRREYVSKERTQKICYHVSQRPETHVRYHNEPDEKAIC